MARKDFPDIEFAVGDRRRTFDSWDEALNAAFTDALIHGKANLDVLVLSERGARAWGGEDAAARYEEDPDASVFERYVVGVSFQGRVP